ncbi:MAG: helix-turn-helix domain-containing protein [Dysosmobacter sp.]
MCGQQRVKDAVAARQIAMYLIRGMTNLPVVEIGKVFDNRDHSTVLYSHQAGRKADEKDPAFAETVKEIKTNINSRH